MHYKKIIPSLWFSASGGFVSTIVEYYKNIFYHDFNNDKVIPLGNTPSGNTEMCEVTIFGHQYSFMCTEKVHNSFNDSFSFTLLCKDQEEIDKYWYYFTKEGEEAQCGWCNDTFGLRWQIIPKIFGELINMPNAGEIMMKQKKIIIAEYHKDTSKNL